MRGAKGRRARRRATALALCVALGVSGSALAGGPDDPVGDEDVLGKRGGLKYIAESLEVGTGGTHSPPAEATYIACGGHSSPWHPASGGVELSGAAAANLIAVQRPMDLDAPFESPPNDKTDDWWQNVVRSVVGRTMTGYAICSKRGMRYELSDSPDGPTAERTDSAACDPGFRLVGGGAFIATSGSYVNSSFPARRNLWRARIFDTAGGIGGMNVYAICRRKGGIEIERRSKRNVAAGARTAVTAVCGRDRHVIAGGGKISGSISEAHLAGSIPVDRRDADTVPDDGWRVIAYNGSGAPKRVTASALCVSKG